jgi:prefoldin alpha subunit
MTEESSNEYVQALAAQLQEIQGYVMQLKEQSSELEQGLKALEIVSQGLSGQRVRIPIIHGLYVDGFVDDTDHVLIDVGTGVFVKKSFDQAHTLVKNRYEELTRVQEHLTEQFNSLYEEFMSHQQK